MICVYMIIGISCIIFHQSLLLIILPFLCSLIRGLSIIAPRFESFKIEGDSIYAYTFYRSRQISIPDELVLVFSLADLCPPLAVPTAIGKETHILKDKIAVNVLGHLNVYSVLEVLHRHKMRTCTMSSVKYSFDEYQFIYSFVCDKPVLEELMNNRKCHVIVPRSLVDQVNRLTNITAIHVYDNSEHA